MHSYTINAASVGALAALLEAAQAGKSRPFVSYNTGVLRFDGARIVYPSVVYRDEGEPYALLDPEGAPVLDENDAPVIIQPRVVDHWMCEICLEEPDADIAAIAA